MCALIITTADQILRTTDWQVKLMDDNLNTTAWNVAATDRALSVALFCLFTFYENMSALWRLECTLKVIQSGYYPFLAIIGVPSKSL